MLFITCAALMFLWMHLFRSPGARELFCETLYKVRDIIKLNMIVTNLELRLIHGRQLYKNVWIKIKLVSRAVS